MIDVHNILSWSQQVKAIISARFCSKLLFDELVIAINRLEYYTRRPDPLMNTEGSKLDHIEFRLHAVDETPAYIPISHVARQAQPLYMRLYTGYSKNCMHLLCQCDQLNIYRSISYRLFGNKIRWKVNCKIAMNTFDNNFVLLQRTLAFIEYFHHESLI